MKVFFVLDVAFPSANAPSKRVISYIKGLKNSGINSQVLTISTKGRPEYAEGIDYKKIGKGHQDTLISKFYVGIYNIFSLIKYLKREASSSDVIFLYTTRYTNGILSMLLHKKYTCVCEMNEIPFYSDTFFNKMNRWLYFHSFYKSFDGIVVISEILKDIAYRYKSKSCQVIKIPILVDVNKYTSCHEIDSKVNAPLIFHSGTHTEEKDGFMGIVQALGIVKRKYDCFIDLYCTQEPPQAKKYEELVEEYGLKNRIHYLGTLTDNDLMLWQRKSIMFIINKYDTFQNRYCFATKLGEYLVSKKLVIITDVGEATNYLTNQENAVIVHAGDIDELADNIYFYSRNKEKRDEIATQGKIIAEKYFDCIPNGEILKSFLLQISHSRKV